MVNVYKRIDLNSQHKKFKQKQASMQESKYFASDFQHGYSANGKVVELRYLCSLG